MHRPYFKYMISLFISFQVNHSQRISDTPLRPWVAIQKDGQVISAHCTCMAGLSEVCSHIAATLFAMESAIRHVQSKSCTSGPRQWGQNPVKGGAELFARASEINFSNPNKRKSTEPTAGTSQQKIVSPVTDEERETFYDSLAKSGVKCGILSILPKYAASFTPKSVLLKLPPPLTSMYSPDNRRLSYTDLIAKCEEILSERIHIDQTQVKCYIALHFISSTTMTFIYIELVLVMHLCSSCDHV